MLILKILGITLLVVLGLVLLILILVLCVPFRYQVRGRYDEKLKAKAGFSWLLKMVHVKLEAIQTQIRVRVCVFGHAFKKMYLGNWGDNAPDAEKEEKDKKEKEKDEGPAAEAAEEEEEEKTEAAADEQGPEPADDKKEAVSSAGAAKAEKTKKARPTPKEKYEELFEELQRKQEEKEKAKAAAAEEKKKAEESAAEAEEEAVEAEEEDRTFLETAVLWTERISDFWDDEKNQKAVYLVEKQLLKLGKHLVPTKFLLKGDLGLGDPAKTGKTIGKIYRFYPLFGDNIQLNGVLDEKRTDLYLELKGRIRLGILVEIAVRLLLNGRIRRWIRYFLKKDKEEKKPEKKAEAKAEKAEKKASGKAA